MLLRRITKHIKEQNWIAVAIDMLVVVFGVYLGFQLNSWNEDSQNVQKGESYLDRIADELEQDDRFFEVVISSNKRNIENAEFLLNTIDDEGLVREDPTRFITSLAFVGSSFVVNVSNNTFEEIKFSGNLELIKDEELRNQIADYYDFIEVERNFSHMRLDAETEYQKRVAGLLSPEQSNFMQDVTYSEVDALLIYERFIQKQELIDWIPIVMNAKRGTVGFSTRAQENAQKLLSKIRGDIEIEPTEASD